MAAASVRFDMSSSGFNRSSSMEFEHKMGAFDDEGLVAADKEKKDWKGIVISLLVIGSIMGAIIVAIILCTPGKFEL